MKIAFISGPYESLGLEYLSAMIKASGHSVKLFIEPCIFQDDAVYVQKAWLNSATDFSDFIANQIKDYKPDLVGISAVTDYYAMYLKIAAKIKSRYRVPIVFGGVHPSAVPERVLETGFVDYVCVGEGENAFVELVQALDQGKEITRIRNIWGRTFRNEMRPLIENLDQLPFPDKDLFYRESSFFRHTYVCMTSRGCFFDCSYCFNSYYRKIYEKKGVYFRRRSVENVIEELAQGLNKRGYSNVRFADDIFNHDKKWIKDFFKLYKQGINKPFDCQLWLDSVDPEIAEILKQSGCYLVEIGIQSLSKEVREKTLGRFYENSVVEKSIDMLKSAGIRVLCENIYGLPGQNIEHIKASLRFYAQKKVLASFYGLSFYPKTRIIDIAEKQKILTKNDIDSIETGRNNLLFTYGGDSLTSD